MTPTLPVETWAKIIQEASDTLSRFSELTSLNRSLRAGIFHSSTYKALILISQHGHTLRHRLHPRYLLLLPDRQETLLRLLSMNAFPTLHQPQHQHFGEDYSLLHLAAQNGMYALAHALLEDWGVSPNGMSSRYRNPTPLFLAAERGDAVMVGLLLAYGADPGFKNDRNETALVRAARTGNMETVRMLAEGLWPCKKVFERLRYGVQGGVIHCDEVLDETAGLPDDSIMALTFQRRRNFRKSFTPPVPPNTEEDEDQDHDLTQALFSACTGRHANVIRYIISCGASPNAVQRRWFRWRPLHQTVHSFRSGAAASDAVLECVQALVDVGADVSAVGMDGSAVEMAERRRGLEKVVMFLERGVRGVE
ncbi:hypothetical protein HDU67_006563 [Dinochytrium kinnereticum]|nr:hypothetical protein HDU67_006563 [Dinochytrium kinnereticum]